MYQNISNLYNLFKKDKLPERTVFTSGGHAAAVKLKIKCMALIFSIKVQLFLPPKHYGIEMKLYLYSKYFFMSIKGVAVVVIITMIVVMVFVLRDMLKSE